jgi:hypothetical protein
LLSVKFAFAPGNALDDEAGIFVNEYAHPVSPLRILICRLRRVPGFRGTPRNHFWAVFLTVFLVAVLVTVLAVFPATDLTVFLATGLTTVRALGL